MEKANLGLPGDREQEINGRRTDIYTLLYIAQITNKDLLYSTGKSTQYSVMAYMGKNLKQSIYIYIHIYACLVAKLCLTLLLPHVQPARFFCPWDFRQECQSGLPFPSSCPRDKTQVACHHGSSCVCVGVCVCLWVSLIHFAVQEKLTQHYKATIRQ